MQKEGQFSNPLKIILMPYSQYIHKVGQELGGFLGNIRKPEFNSSAVSLLFATSIIENVRPLMATEQPVAILNPPSPIHQTVCRQC